VDPAKASDPYAADTDQIDDYDVDTPDVGWLPPFVAGLLAAAGSPVTAARRGRRPVDHMGDARRRDRLPARLQPHRLHTRPDRAVPVARAVGIDGPGCVGTRMVWYLLHGNVVQAARHLVPSSPSPLPCMP
jgi:hypothetical protein